MRVLVIEPMKKPLVKDISPGLESLQNEVGGGIEVVYPFDDPVGIICNEEGKLLSLPLNRALYAAEDADSPLEIYDVIAGTFLVAGLSDDDFCDLPPDMIEKYAHRFADPELIGVVNGRPFAVPLHYEEENDCEVKDD